MRELEVQLELVEARCVHRALDRCDRGSRGPERMPSRGLEPRRAW
jgi:hypothetical protein